MFSAKDLVFAKGPTGGYTIAKSLRFRSSASAYLSRTPGSAGNRKTWTFSAWVKRGALGNMYWGGNCDSGGLNGIYIQFNSNDTFLFAEYGASSYNWQLVTTQVFRDPSAWYHFVLVVDTTQATSSNRVKIYINGSQVTSLGTATYPTLNSDTYWNAAQAAAIGRAGGYASSYFDGYLSEINNIDGQALDPTYFGQTDTATGVWMPKAYTGTYGTNGFYLNFSDASAATAAAIGKDSSGNGNNWTPTNISVTAGVTYDSMVDTPTNYDNGGNGAGNYAVLNPLAVHSNGAPVLSNGNLTTVTGATGAGYSLSTIAIPASGKYYFEAIASATAGGVAIGIIPYSLSMNAFTGTACAYYNDGTKFVNGVNSAYGSAYTTNLIGVAIDVDGGTITFYRDNVSQGAITYASAGLFPFVSDGSSTLSSTLDVNFGQRPFTYTPPSGFKALCTQNLPTPTIGATSSTLASAYMNILTYTGNGTTNGQTQTISGNTFTPDFMWIKSRSSSVEWHGLADTVRAGGNVLASNATNAEYGGGITSQTNGFQVTYYSGGNAVSQNTNNNTYVGWLWKANGSGSSNTSGSITSTVSANVTAGFSVVTYTGTGANATVGHGLGVAPKMVIVKNRDVNWSWRVYHASLANTQILYLDATSAATTDATAWNSTSPTPSVFSIGTSGGVNESTKKLVAYCFAEVAGYSKFGSYTGNNSADGPYVYCGFKPKFVLVKDATTAGAWAMFDASRSTYNVGTQYLQSQSSGAEVSAAGQIDFLSNGFKLRADNANSAQNNVSGNTYIFAAFAESPFNYARAR